MLLFISIGSDIPVKNWKDILEEFEKVADLHFVEVTESKDEVGAMRFGWTDHLWKIGDNHAAGWASSPSGGDVWLYNKNGVPADDALGIGKNTGAMTLLHEIGHALGLNHSFEGNVFSNQNKHLDSSQYTVMSYTNDKNAGVWIDGKYVFTVSSTPMLLDIASLQHLYGAQETTNLGDTTYKYGECYVDDMPPKPKLKGGLPIQPVAPKIGYNRYPVHYT